MDTSVVLGDGVFRDLGWPLRWREVTSSSPSSMHASKAKPTQPTACALFKGNLKQARRIHYRTWRLQDQSRLCAIYDSRQARRKKARMQLEADRKFASGMDWFAAITAFETAISCCSHFNSKEPSDGDDDDDDDDEEATRKRGGSAKAAGSRRKRKGSESPPPDGRDPKKPKRGAGGGGGGGDGGDDDGDGSDDDDGDANRGSGKGSKGLGKKDKAKATKPRRKPGPKQYNFDVNDLEDDGTFAGHINAIIVANDPTLRNTVRMARKLKGLKLKIVRKPTATKPEGRLVDFLDQPALPDRDFRPHSRSHKSKAWTFSFKHGKDTKVAPKTTFTVPHAALAPDATTADQTKLHEELARMYNTWSFKIEGLAPLIKQRFLAIAVSNVFAQPLQVDQVTHGDTASYKTQVTYIEPVTGAHKKINVIVTATDSQMQKVIVPPLPALNILKPSDQTITRVAADSSFHTSPPDLTKAGALGKNQTSSLVSQHRAEDAAYWIAAQLSGLIATDARMTELLVMYREQIGLSKSSQHKSGLYGGEADLYSFSYRRSNMTTLVAPTQKVATDFGLTPAEMSLYVHSLNASRATPVMEKIIQVFCGGADMTEVWIDAAKTADSVNMDIRDKVPPSSRCDCDDMMTATERHACEVCGKPAICQTRRWDSMARLVCQACMMRDQSFLAGGRRPGESFAAFLAHRSLWLNFKKECSTNGKDANKKRFKDMFESAWTTLKARLPAGGDHDDLQHDERTTYVNEWTGLTHDLGEERALIGNNPSRRRVIPYGITVDTIHRQGHPDNDGLRHFQGNVAITSNVCQHAKGEYNPGALHEIGEFLRLKPEEQALDSNRKALVDKLTDMAVVNCKRRYINAGKGSALDKYFKIRAEQVAGNPTKDEPGPWDNEARQLVHKPIPRFVQNGKNLWDDVTWARTQKCAETTEKYFGVKLYKLRDGTRWIGKDYTDPDLNRNGIVLLCRERLQRMRLDCNKKWQTIDNEETLYQELLFQYCCSVTKKPELQWLKSKYGDRLGLPMVLWKHSPLLLSIAHRVHGSGMFSGWASGSPLDVEERLTNDDQNNMLVETWFVNSAKLDMAEEYYGELDTILRTAQVTDKDIYNPASIIPVSQAVPTTKEVDDRDDFLGATFNNEVAGASEGDEVGEDELDKQGTTTGAGDNAGGLGGAAAQGNEGTDTQEQGDPGDAAPAASDTVSVMDQAISSVLQTITEHEGLTNQLIFDPDLQRLIGTMRQHADAGTQNKFDQCMGVFYEQYVNPAQEL